MSKASKERWKKRQEEKTKYGSRSGLQVALNQAYGQITAPPACDHTGWEESGFCPKCHNLVSSIVASEGHAARAVAYRAQPWYLGTIVTTFGREPLVVMSGCDEYDLLPDATPEECANLPLWSDL